MKKPRTLDDLLNDPRIERIEKDFDGKGRHLVECKSGFRFEGERTIDIGTIKELCEAVSDWLEPYSYTTLS